MFINLVNLVKGSGRKYIFVNMICIFIFFIAYWGFSYTELEFNNPWYYWLYFSIITQTTVGYASIEDINKSVNTKEHEEVSVISLRSKKFMICLFLQLFSIIFINGYFISSI